jgi:hypothetical protein
MGGPFPCRCVVREPPTVPGNGLGREAVSATRRVSSRAQNDGPRAPGAVIPRLREREPKGPRFLTVMVGVDKGARYLAVRSTGETVFNPQPRKQALRKPRLNRELARRQQGRRHRKQTRQRLARLHPGWRTSGPAPGISSPHGWPARTEPWWGSACAGRGYCTQPAPEPRTGRHRPGGAPSPAGVEDAVEWLALGGGGSPLGQQQALLLLRGSAGPPAPMGADIPAATGAGASGTGTRTRPAISAAL